MRHPILAAALAAVLLAPGPAEARKSELILFETPGCSYCKAWLRDVAPGYSSSRHGSILPLRRIDLSRGIAEEDRDMLPVRGVPTFVVRACNREMARFSGYGGKDAFYAKLDAAVVDIKRKGC